MMLRTAGQNRKLVETQGRIKFDVKKMCIMRPWVEQQLWNIAHSHPT